MASTEWDNGFFILTREAHIVLDQGGTVVGWNPAAGSLLQISPEDAMGQDWATLVPELARLILATPGTRNPTWQRCSVSRRDGTPLFVEASVGWHGGYWLIVLADQRPFVAIEATAAALQKRILHLLDVLPVVVNTISLRDDEFTVLYQSARGNEYSGWANAEWDRDPDFTLKILHPDDREW